MIPKTHSAKFLRQRKMMVILPLMILPFLTMAFWALGGGQNSGEDGQLKQQAGLNIQLPDALLKEDGNENKLSFYKEADADSLKRREIILNDPAYRNSIDTSIEIRDQRMRELFFETDTYPTAEVTAEIENDLPLMAPYNIDFNFTLHGQSHAFQVPVIIHSGSADMMVTSAEDVILSATNYGLGSALENLREIAGLESINPQVRVSFKLHFKQIY